MMILSIQMSNCGTVGPSTGQISGVPEHPWPDLWSPCRSLHRHAVPGRVLPSDDGYGPTPNRFSGPYPRRSPSSREARGTMSAPDPTWTQIAAGGFAMGLVPIRRNVDAGQEVLGASKRRGGATDVLGGEPSRRLTGGGGSARVDGEGGGKLVGHRKGPLRNTPRPPA